MERILKKGFDYILLSILALFLLLQFNVTGIFSKATSSQAETILNNKTNSSSDISVVNQLYTAMVNRESEVTLECKNPKDIYKTLNNEELFLAASEIDNPETTDDYDYLYNNIDSYTITTLNNGVKVKLKWLEDKDQLKQVNKKVKSIIKETGVMEMTTDYEKAKVLHDYIINTTDYDYSCQKYTSFNALFNQSTVCQGYSLLYYKLLTEVGIECRFITGYSNNEYHGWNIVKIGNYWYNVDVTWDDLENNSITYDYFLKGSNTFNKDHKRDDKFNSNEFKQAYPTATNDF